MIWLIGNKGMLGTEIQFLLEARKMSYCVSDREVDITDKPSLESFCKNKNISVIINCSAYTAVDKAEDEPEQAYSINAIGVKNIAELSYFIRSKLIHFSTDYVFNGQSKTPYTETDTVDPIGIYGKTKLEGEQAIQSVLPQHFIIRTAWLYGRYGNNFVKTMLALFQQRASVAVVSDQIGSPTYTFDLALAVLKIIESGSTEYGIYHFSNEGQCSWHEFAIEIYKQSLEKGIVVNPAVKINPISTAEYPTKAKRQSYSLLSKNKIKTTFSLSIRNWKEALSHYWE
jgi:dTDP-4-dehydrorhamnose reductase